MNIFQIILTQPLTNGLILFYKVLWQNMGLAIIAFSLFLRTILNPLTRQYVESMKKMKELAPQLSKLKERHRDSKEALMKAQADFYKEKGINPGAGCLPYLIQIVVLIFMFNVFSRVLSANGDTIGKLNELLYAPLKFAEGEIFNKGFLYLDVTRPDTFRVSFLPIALPGPILILAALIQGLSAKMAGPQVAAEKKIAAKTEGMGDDFATAMQSSAIYTFPLLTILAGVRFPSGLAIYWLVFSVYQMIQQYTMSGWGGLTPLIRRLGLIKLQDEGKGKNKQRGN